MLLASLGLPGSAWGIASFSNVLGSNMVLQRDKPLHLWGKAAPGETVTVTFNAATALATADASGKWSLYLPPMPANASPQSVSLQGLSNTVTLSNVLIGDVWFCSGQSNMEFPLNAPNFWFGSSAALPNGVSDAANANLPELRVLHIPAAPLNVSVTALDNLATSPVWAAAVAASNTNLRNYSALGFYICRELNTALGVPIGMIGAAYGGSPAEAFVSMEAILAEPALAAVIPVGTPVTGTRHHWPTGLFNGEINPFTPMTIKGFLWDQGESNTNVGVWGGPGLLPSSSYATLFTVLIKDWRARFGEELPFVYVQLQNLSFLASNPPPVNQASADNCNAQQTSSNGWGDVRWGQAEALDLTMTGMSVNIDLNANAMYYSSTMNQLLAHIYHPPNREDFAARMLPWIKSKVYGLPAGAYTPRYLSWLIVGPAIQLNFDALLGTKDGLSPRGFMLGDSMGTWVWADAAVLAGNTITVSAASMPNPLKVKYGWGNNPSDPICAPSQIANLSDVTQASLVSPFQTLDEALISVEGNAIPMSDSDLNPQIADGRDFGIQDLAVAASRTFSIKNLGNAVLNLTGGATLVRVAGQNAADFTVMVQPASSVAISSSTTFSVRFQPGAAGERRAVVQIPNNDPNRTPYYIYLKGSGSAGPPVLAGPLPAPGPLKILNLRAVPNPNPAAFMLLLAGPAELCQLLIYSSGMRKVAQIEGPGRNSPGWVKLAAGNLDLPNGIYYIQATAIRGGLTSGKTAIGKFSILR